MTQVIKDEKLEHAQSRDTSKLREIIRDHYNQRLGIHEFENRIPLPRHPKPAGFYTKHLLRAL
jgi:hypothetical protein